jgi:hypothetical protein
MGKKTDLCKIIVKTVIDIYRILVCSFYSIFVVQECEKIINNSTIVVSCSYRERIEHIQKYDIIVLIFNGCNFMILLIGFIYEFYREKWMIYNLHRDSKYSIKNLKKELEENKQIRKNLYKINRNYLYLYVVICVFNVINLVVSIIQIYDNYYGITTITTLLTNILLLGLRLERSIVISYVCKQNERAQSISMISPYEYNRIHDRNNVIELDIL